MGAVDFIVLGVIAAVLVGCVVFLVRSKKKGVKCIGCPAGCCSAKNGCGGCNGTCKQN